LERQDLSVPGREVVPSRVEIGPEARMVKHTHPGEEIIYILEGSLEYQIEPLQGAGCRRRGRPDLEP
jgi:quercetin dioxygenase-like cupin family protein